MENTFELVRRVTTRGVIPPSPPQRAIAESTPPRQIELIQPEFIYLGHDEFSELMTHPEIFQYIGYTDETNERKFFNVPIIPVSRKSHFAIGWKPSLV